MSGEYYDPRFDPRNDPRYAAYYAAQRQTSAPNQMPNVPDAYRPDIAADISPVKSGDINRKLPGDTFSVKTYDAKPPACETLFISQSSTYFAFKVPASKIAIIKSIVVAPYSLENSPLYSLTTFIYDLSYRIKMTVNGSNPNLHSGDCAVGTKSNGQPNYGNASTDIYTYGAAFGPVEINLFLPLGPEDVLIIQPMKNDVNGDETSVQMFLAITGDLLNSTGRSLQQEFGNTEPLPTTQGSNTK